MLAGVGGGVTMVLRPHALNGAALQIQARQGGRRGPSPGTIRNGEINTSRHCPLYIVENEIMPRNFA